MKKKYFKKLLASVMVVVVAVIFILTPTDASVLESYSEENTKEDEISTTEEKEVLEIQDEEQDSTEGIITPRWRTVDHMEDQCNYVIKQLGLNSKQSSWLKDGVSAPDDKYSDIRGFHAKQKTNYLACLKAVFMFAQLIGTNGTVSKKTQILNSMPNIDSDTRNDVSQMVEKMNAYFDSKGSTTENQRKYIAYGFGLHLLGDMYAHRIMVKVSNLEKWGKKDTSTNKYLQDRDFIPEKIQSVKDAIRRNEVNTGSLKDYMPAKDTYTFIINYPSNSTTKNPGRVYPDNPTFMPKRFDAVKSASVSFMQNVRSKNSFNNVNFFLNDYNLSLHKYNEFKGLI